MRAGFLHNSHEFPGVCRTKKLHDRKQSPGDRHDARDRTDDGLNARKQHSTDDAVPSRG